MANYLHTFSIASVSGQKYAPYFKNRAKLLDYSNAMSMSHFYQGYIGRSIKSGKFINTKVIDTNVNLIGIMSTFNEVQWLQQQSATYAVEINTGRDLFNPTIKNKIKEDSIKIKREPKRIGYKYYTLGNVINEKAYVECRALALEKSIISTSETLRYNDNYSETLDGWNDADCWPDGYKGSKRSRCWRFFFIEKGIAKEELAGKGYLGNISISLYENSNIFKQLDMSICQRKPRGAASGHLPYIAIGGSYSIAYNSLRIMGGVCFCENPNPEILSETSTSINYKDYPLGYGKSVLFIFVLDTRNGAYTPIRLDVTPTNSSEEKFFYLEKYEENAEEWREGELISTPPPRGGKFLGYVPNLLGQPLIVTTTKGFAIYLSGVRSHYGTRSSVEGGTYGVYDSQTAVLRIYFKLQKDGSLAFEETKVIEHDASGNSLSFNDFDGTDSKFWNIYHTLWAETVNDKEIVLVSNTRHKRYDYSEANLVGSSVKDIGDPDTNLETFFHIYIDQKVYKFNTASLKFGANLTSENNTTNRRHKYLWYFADIYPVMWGRKYATVISDTEVLFCFRSYPKHDENLLVKFNIETQNFEVLKRTPKSEGDIVATCYQRRVTDKDGKEIIPAGIIYRVGTQGKKGTVYISKDSGKTFNKIIDSPYTAGGGLYYLGNEFYTINYGNAFAENNNKKP